MESAVMVAEALMLEAFTVAEAAAEPRAEACAPMPCATPPDVRASVAIAVVGRIAAISVVTARITGIAVIAGIVARHANPNSHHDPRTRRSCGCHRRARSGARHQQGAYCQFSETCHRSCSFPERTPPFVARTLGQAF